MQQQVPTPKSSGARAAPTATLRPLPNGPVSVDDMRRGGPPTIAGYLLILWEGRRTVIAITAAVLMLGFAYLIVASPWYEATSVVRVEARRSTLTGLEELTAVFGEDPGEAEIEIVRSRSLIGSVVDQLNLALTSEPRTFPIVGKAIARRYTGKGPAPAPFGLTRYAWGGEQLEVDRLQVPPELVGKTLVLTALGDDAYEVTTDEGATLVKGTVGTPALSDERAGAPAAEVLVSKLVARPETQFRLVKANRESIIDAVHGGLRVEQRGRRTGILVVNLEGTDPLRVTSIVDAVTTTYLRQNVERKSAEAAKTLEFIESQLPQLKDNLDKAERALNAFRVSSGTVNTPVETQAILEREREYDRQISELELRRSQLRQSFTENHPNLVAVQNQVAQLKAERNELHGRMKLLPKAEVDSARLAREVTDATNLYVGLLNKAQELRVVKSGTIGDVRIIDRAHVPSVPSRPRKGAVIVLTLMLGLVVGAAAAILRKSLAKYADSPEEIETATGLPVFVTIPRSVALAEASLKRRATSPLLLARTDPEGGAMETLRSLRTSLQFALVESHNQVICVTGPAPGVGKSFVAMNLAHVLAAAGKKVLLVDCDLRRGRLHRQFALDRKPGVSDVVSGAATVEQAVRATPEKDLYLLSTGRIPPNPAELLSAGRFEAMLRELSQAFDLIVVDTPPILAVSDAMLVARLAGVNLLVLRAGMHNSREIALSLKQFDLNGVRLNGSVLNDMRSTKGGSYGSSGYLRYDYQSDASDAP